MKRLYARIILILVVGLLALPAVARADEVPAPAGEQTEIVAEPLPVPDGWTWDEGVAPDPQPEPAAELDGWTWDEV